MEEVLVNLHTVSPGESATFVKCTEITEVLVDVSDLLQVFPFLCFCWLVILDSWKTLYTIKLCIDFHQSFVNAK